MTARTHNLEPRARALCETEMRAVGYPEVEAARLVERHWPNVAAEIQAGIIDDEGRRAPFDYERGLAAWRAWIAERRA